MRNEHKIDFEGFDKYLEARSRRKYFVPPPIDGGFLTMESIESLAQLVKKYPIVEVGKCFPPMNEGPRPYFLKFKCILCNCDSARSFSKTCLMKFIKEFHSQDTIEAYKRTLKLTCKQCEKLKEQKKEDRDSIERREALDQEILNTMDYVETYLDPNKSWNSGVKAWEKWNYIRNPRIYVGEVRRHIRSMNYKEFLKTPFWKAISEKKKSMARYRCQLCNGGGHLQTHHRTYENHGAEHEHMEDLIVLCSSCHEKFHELPKEPE